MPVATAPVSSTTQAPPSGQLPEPEPQTPFIGSRLSLISNSDIRYEGILHSVNTKDATVALAKVRSFGTEDRSATHAVSAASEEYEFIIFKADDIKDLIMCESPPPPQQKHMNALNDPAIVSMSQPEMGGFGSNNFMNSGRSNMSRSSHLSDGSAAAQLLWPQGHVLPKMSPPAFNSYNGHGHGHYNQNQNRGLRGRRAGQGQYGLLHPPVIGAGPGPLPFAPMQPYLPHRSSPGNVRGGNGQFRMRHNATGGYLKFEKDFDFEQANQQFKHALDKLQIDGDQKCIKPENGEGDKVKENEVGAGESRPSQQKSLSAAGLLTYDKQRSFFDMIGSNKPERASRQDRNRKVNSDTFGQSALRYAPGRMSAGGDNYNNGYGYGGRGQGQMYAGGARHGQGPWMPMPMPPPHVVWEYMQAMQHQQGYGPPMPPPPPPFHPRGRGGRYNR